MHTLLSTLNKAILFQIPTQKTRSATLSTQISSKTLHNFLGILYLDNNSQIYVCVYTDTVCMFFVLFFNWNLNWTALSLRDSVFSVARVYLYAWMVLLLLQNQQSSAPCISTSATDSMRISKL